MRMILPLFMLFLANACNSSTEKTSIKETPKDSSRSLTNPVDTMPSSAGFALLPFDKDNLPLKDSLQGHLVDGACWRDLDGENLVILLQTDNKMVNDQQNQRITAYAYKKESGAWKQKWLVQDKISGCEVDATCTFFPGSLSVTDVDHNNVGEVCFLYKLSCKGDVSPDDKKLILYEGSAKYAIRGNTILEYSGGREGGAKNIDPSFNKASKELLEYANSRWELFGLTRY
ncbi:MAG: hypothetical protein IPI66_05040 [Chitinophagaceae bacterium]|nr:hypothetical protein [Chitinophagaceae bacterium]MBL0055711.1 hypothetical protein [Chitinophagaceae bacterium]